MCHSSQDCFVSFIFYLLQDDYLHVYVYIYIIICIHVLVYVNTKLYYINSNSVIVSNDSNEQHTLTLIWLLILSQLLPKHWTSDF